MPRAIASSRRSSASSRSCRSIGGKAPTREGRKRDISATTLEKPLGSGAYRIKEFVPGRTLTLERVKDHWGRDSSTNVGRNNFDELRLEYFRDSTVALEAFKGDQVDWRTENSAKNWATAYDFPAVNDKRVLLEEFPNRSSGIMQAFALNIRREQFKDARVRRALNFAFDFEEMNKQIFFGQYKRISSYFDGTDLASSGLPEGRELEILEAVRTEVPPELFTKPYTNPVGGSPEAVRENLREALRLLKEAGYEVRERKLVDSKSGAQFTLELLGADPCFERVMLFFKPSLERLGIAVSVRTIDPTQYENRLRSWDFDVVVSSWPESLSPGNEQREYWGSQAADTAGSRNIIGIKNPVIDKLIDRLIFAKGRDDLVAATKALDRVLLWNHYVVPQWNYPKIRTARWDRFGRPIRIAEIRPVGFPGAVVVRRRQGGAERKTVLKDIRAWRNSPAGTCSVSVSARWRLRAFAPALADNGGRKLHGLSAFGELKYPADFPHLAYVNPAAPKGGMFSATRRLGPARPSIRSTPSSSRAKGERDGPHFRLADGAGVR